MKFIFAGFVALVAASLLPGTAHALGKCSFKPSPPVTLKSAGDEFGFCKFHLSRLSYAGDPVEQARCLLTPVRPVGRLGAALESLPPVLAERVGRTSGLPERARLGAWLGKKGLGDPLGDSLAQAVSRARDGDASARPSTYFVIHDTSSPNYGGAPWPHHIDEDAKINNLNRYRCSNDIERAHVFINRGGAILLAHDFSVAWRATKFEMATNFEGALKGLFLHVELVQPRRRDPKHGRGNDFLAPQPGFSRAQYDALAVVYAVASVRAGFWLIPAYHSVIDEGIRNKHDDPQNFELADFARSLSALLQELEKAGPRGAVN